MIHISVSPGPVSNTALTEWRGDLDTLVAELLSDPKPGGKDGSYFVRGPFKSLAKRADENMDAAHVVILDGDKRIHVETGEVFEGAPAPVFVHEALIDARVSHVLFTSHSHQDPNRGGANFHRWRCLVFVQTANAEELRAVVDYLIRLLHARQVMLAPARENYVWSQPWFLPRLRTPDSPFLLLRYDDGDPLDVPEIVADYRVRSATECANATAEAGKRNTSGNGSISRFLVEHGSAEAIIERLEAHGYVLRHTTTINGEVAYRLIRPGSTSGIPGLIVFLHRDRSKWLCFSHHGEADPLAGSEGQALGRDAFDVFRILECGGDERVALQKIRAEQQEDPPDWRFDAPPLDEEPPDWRFDAPPPEDEAQAQRERAEHDRTKKGAGAAFSRLLAEHNTFPVDALDTAPPEPKFILPNWLPADVTALVATGGSGKSTLNLQKAVAVILGLEVFGMLPAVTGPVVVVTAEDDAARILYRLYHICQQMGLSPAQKRYVLANLYVEDLCGTGVKLAEVGKNGNICTTQLAEALIGRYGEVCPAIIEFDPLVKFGPGERFVNDGEDAVVNAALSIRRALSCNVSLTHHVSKAVARTGIVDHLSGRGGSALGDGVRAVYQIRKPDESAALRVVSADELERGSLIELHCAKVTDAKQPTAPIYLYRKGWLFEHREMDDERAEKEREKGFAVQVDVDICAIVDFLAAKLKEHPPTRYSRNTLEDARDNIRGGLTRARLRHAVHTALERKALTELPLPKDHVHGGKQKFLAPNNRYPNDVA